MRLSLVLNKWPRSRPNGYIWSGKHQMVRKVRESHINTMEKQIEMVITLIRNIIALFYHSAFPGEEQRVCLSESFHLSRGGKGRHGGEREDWSQGRPIIIQVSLKS